MNSTPGEILRAKREEKQLTLLQAAQSTSIKPEILQALEEDRLDVIPSKAQYRGFMRLYASYLGVDSQAILPVEKKEPVVVDEGAPEPIQAPLDGAFHPVKPVKATDAISGLAAKISGALPANRKKSDKTSPTPGAAGNGAVNGVTASSLILEDIGRSLEQQREALGLSRADVERQTRIREFYIYALEKGKLQDLPSTVQGRGMLGNYAEFMNLDSDSLQIRFAEALQQRRLELLASENTNTTLTGPESRVVKKIPGWHKFLSPDMLLSGGLFIGLFVFIVWGAMQVINTSNVQATEDPGSISEFLIQSSIPGTQVGGSISQVTATPVSTAAVNVQETSTAIGSGPVQVVVVARQRAYLRITTDNEVVFDGRIVPGNVYTFSANKSILLLTGDASAIQVIYNQEDQGVLGSAGQVVLIDYTLDGVVNPTPRFSPTPTLTQAPTYTAQPTATPTVTPKPSVTP